MTFFSKIMFFFLLNLQFLFLIRLMVCSLHIILLSLFVFRLDRRGAVAVIGEAEKAGQHTSLQQQRRIEFKEDRSTVLFGSIII